MGLPFLQRTRRLALAVVLGASAWPALSLLFPYLPLPLRFLSGWFLFTFGPGVFIGGSLVRRLDPLRRIIITLGIGSAATPLVIDLLGRMHLVAAFPYFAAAFTAASIALWIPGTAHTYADNDEGRLTKGDLAACAALVALAVGLGAIVFWHRLDTSGGAIVLYGDYDTADLSYYAGEASEASHTVPPTAFYYSGHKLNAAYYPHLVLAMINRFCAVPILPIYYGFGWPTFLALTALTGYTLVRSLASRGVATLAVVLILVGGDFSYLAAWLLPHTNVDWDFVLWPTNFLSPTMEVLHFSTWGPSLPVFFTVLFTILRGLHTRSWCWLLVSGFLLGALFEFKPFAFIVLMAALSATTLFAVGDWPARRRLAATIALGVLFALPSIWAAATIDESDRRSRLLIDSFLLPERMLIKTDLTETFLRTAARLAPSESLETPLFLAMATLVFLAGGIGVRWLGAPGVWRAIRRHEGQHAASWRLLAWTVVAGVAIPFVIATQPYVDTLQFHITGLYVLWIFVALALVRFAGSHPVAGRLAILAVLAVSLPSSIHFLARKWTDAERAPRVSMTRGEAAVAQYLRRFDPQTTVVLHDRPLAPSLTTIVAARRIVLGWDVRYSAVGGEERLRDVNRFYGSVDGDPEAEYEILRRYDVTHVIVRDDDRVHPEILAKLQPLLSFPGVDLYAVPAAAGP